jgi:hypothetical protein
MKSGLRLLIINYSMDTKNSIFSHQYEAACGLMGKFSSVTVFTNQKGNCPAVPGMSVISTGWIEGQTLRNTLRVIFKVCPMILKRNYDSVFFHMTDFHAAIFSPIIRLLGRRQVLWYAHAHPSLLLKWAARWVDFIATSTAGSCTLKSQKVILIGQAIKQENFPQLVVSSRMPVTRIVHFGRFDRSKNIGVLIQTCRQLREEGFELDFTQIGNASNAANQIYELEMKKIEKHS